MKYKYLLTMCFCLISFQLKHNSYKCNYQQPIKLEINIAPSVSNIFDYVINKVKDTTFSKRIVGICLNETGLIKGKYFNLNNVACIRYGKRAISYVNYYGVYSDWRDCINDVIDYELKYKERSWYNKYSTNINKLISLHFKK
jgi:hypothetical protein